MSTVWVVSAVLGWAVIALLVAVVLSLLRQTAELRLRLDAFDGGEVFEAPDDDARLHEAVPATVVPLVRGPGHDPEAPAALTLGGLQDQPTLLVFHSPGCLGCRGLPEAMEGLLREDPPVRVVSVLGLDADAAAEHLGREPRSGVPTVSLAALPDELRRPTTPAMLGLSRDGTVALLGRPAGLEDLRRAAEATARA